MIDITHKKCIHNGCILRPNYNFPGEKIAKFCLKHKLQNMVNILSKKCEYLGCGFAAIFNNKGEKPRFCATHKLPEMTNMKQSKSLCEFINCNE